MFPLPLKLQNIFMYKIWKIYLTTLEAVRILIVTCYDSRRFKNITAHYIHSRIYKFGIVVDAEYCPWCYIKVYCLIYANWGMIESHVDGGTLAPEWSNSHLNSQAIGRDHPLGQKIFDEYISMSLVHLVPQTVLAPLNDPVKSPGWTCIVESWSKPSPDL